MDDYGHAPVKRTIQELFGIGLIGMGVLLPISTMMRCLLVPPEYLSTVRIIPPKSAFTTVAREVEIIQSPRILHPAITNLNLNQKFAHRLISEEPLPTEVTFSLLKHQLEVTEEEEAHLISIGVFSEDRGEAADIANEIARVYCAYSRSDSVITNDVASILVAAQPSIRANRPNWTLSISLSLGLAFFPAAAGLWLLAGSAKHSPSPPKLPAGLV